MWPAAASEAAFTLSVADDWGRKSKHVSFPPPLPSRAELTQESSSRGSGGQAQGLSSDENSSPPSSVPQALNFSPEKSDSSPPQGSSTGAAQGEAELPEDMPPNDVLGGGCSHTPSEVRGESTNRTHISLPASPWGWGPCFQQMQRCLGLWTKMLSKGVGQELEDRSRCRLKLYTSCG